ncbi:MAG: peptidoglycan editing factor PgeF [Pseudomonadales bacterium]
MATLRYPGRSGAPYAALNLAYHTGDDAAAVSENRAALGARIGVENIQWLDQVHGSLVVEASIDSAGGAVEADGAVTSVPGLACAVMVADCLPVLLASRAEDRVGALHVGWRGLLAGVLESGVARMAARDLVGWLGPCISGQAYEVGPEVRDAYLEAADADGIVSAFTPSPSRQGHWLMDLRTVAQRRLTALGVKCEVSRRCAYGEQERFFSYRRDGVTGRFAALVWIWCG